MKQKLITLGETMVLFDPVESGSFRNVHYFQKRIAGAESNVAIGVSRLGHQAGWISQVSDDEIGDFLVNSIRGEGVDTTQVSKHATSPTGLLIKEKVREGNTQVYYYRHQSAASKMKKGQINWDYIKQAKVIHLTGITPFLSDECCELIKEVIEFAKKNQVFVSFDPNLRMKLITQVDNHKMILTELTKGVDLYMPGIDEADYLFGTRDPETIFDLCIEMGVKNVVLKDGEHGIYYTDRNETGFIESVKLDRVVDSVGAGDGFAAGVLSSLLEGKTLKQAVERGALIGSLVVSTAGDIEGLPTRRQLKQYKRRCD